MLHRMMLISGRYCQHSTVHYQQAMRTTQDYVVPSKDEATLDFLAREREGLLFSMFPEMETLFSAIEMQLVNIGVEPGERSLREQLVEFTESSIHT
jgi:hypothetical protein